jgi:hypothetical protein
MTNGSDTETLTSAQVLISWPKTDWDDPRQRQRTDAVSGEVGDELKLKLGPRAVRQHVEEKFRQHDRTLSTDIERP